MEKIRKLTMMSVRKCYRLVCNHPFLLGFLFFLFLLYKSFPLLFSLLVSAFPVLVCTALLLGMLLSFGEPRLPEIEKEEERVSQEMPSLKTGGLGNSTVVVSRDESRSTTAERFMGDKRDLIERAIERVVCSNNEARMLGKEEGLLESAPLINDDRSLEALGQDEKRELQEVDRNEEEEDQEEDEESGRDLDGGEVGEHRYRLIEEAEDDVRADSGLLKREPFDADVGSSVGSEVNSADKDEDEDGEDGHGDDDEEEKEEEEEEEDDESLCSGSGSDHAESSSPDASMADILPMLDELHPLLYGEEPLLMNMSRNGSNVASEHSHKSEDGNVRSDDDNENMEGEDGENDEEEEEDEEDGAESEVGGGKGDESKAAITWTEDDQKNLMDLGTSELERNQRLENLIARRRARRLMAERNLIDFDGSDLPFNVPSITTTRRNPFDGPDDSYSNMGLPPIPGSAPSILLPRRNPFDLPYGPNEEKPNLKEDGFQQEFVPSPPTQPPPYQNQPRDNFFFRRHESFSVGPSSLGFSRQERQDLRWKPFFVPEHFGSEGTNFQSFERQSSGMSESKASSVPDTESVTSTVDQEDTRVNEQEEFVHETEEMSNVDRASLLVEHGSATSEDLDHQEIDEEEEKRNTRHDEVEITLGEAEAETESQHDIGSSLSEEGVGTYSSASPLDVDRNGSEVETELLETEAEAEEEEDEENINSSVSGSSPSSFFSEVDEKILEVKKEREEASSSQINYTDEELGSQVEDVEFSFMTGHHKDPVYDSSPPAAEKFLSCSSDSSDLPGSELLGVDMQDENIARNTDVTEIGEDNFHQDGLSESEEVLANQNGASVVPESVNGQASNVLSSASSGIESVGNDLVNDSFLHHEYRGIEHEPSNLSSVTTELGMDIAEPFQSEQAKIDGPVHETSLENIVASKHDQVQNEQAREAEMDTDVQFQDRVERRDTPASTHWHMLSDLSDGMSHGDHPFIPEVRFAPVEELSEMAPEQLGSDSRPSFDEISEEPEPPIVLEESASATLGGNPEETHDDGGQDSVVVSTLTSESPSFSSESSNYESPTIGPDSRDLTAGGTEFGILRRQVSEYYDVSMDEASDEEGDDEIKGMDDGFLTELDTVGDFRVEEAGNESHRPEFVLEEESKGGHSESESLNRSGSGSGLPVLEPRSLEDITMAFRQLQGADVEEVILPSSIDNDVKVPEGTQSGLPVVEARSIDDIHVVKQIVEENAEEMPGNTDLKSRDVEDSVPEGTTDIDEPKSSNDSTRGSSNLPVLEVRSVEDVTVVFKQLDEGAEIEEVILPSSIKDQQDSKISEGTSSGLPLVEARSLDDIHNIVMQVVEDNVEEVPKEADGKAHDTEESVSKGTGDIDELRDSNSSTQGSSSLPVLEVRSVEDVTTAFMQLDEGAEVEEVILPSSIKDQQELTSSDGTNSGLPVIEARSLDDIHNMVKQVMEENNEQVPQEIVESKDRSVEAEVTHKVKEVNSSEAIVSEPEVQETAAVSLGGPEDAEVSTSNSSNSQKKKVRSRKSSSGSSSSSSSSDSD